MDTEFPDVMIGSADLQITITADEVIYHPPFREIKGLVMPLRCPRCHHSVDALAPVFHDHDRPGITRLQGWTLAPCVHWVSTHDHTLVWSAHPLRAEFRSNGSWARELRSAGLWT